MEMLTDAQFWLALGQVVLINLVLSADNAVVIALAARALPGRSQWQALALGAAAVVVARIVLTLLAAYILQWPMLKIVGGLLLLWIAIRLLAQADDAGEIQQARSRWKAVQIIVTADMVMSLDNVLSVAAAAQDHWAALVAGLAVSIPLVVFFAALLSRLMQRWPVIIVIGAALLGWVAGGLLVSDPLWAPWIAANLPWAQFQVGVWKIGWAQLLGAALVVAVGKIWGKTAGA
jgi:YjbE family integral membrane protein